MIVDAIPNDLQFRRNPELRKEGKRAASEIIAVIADKVKELNGLKKLIKTGAGMEEESTLAIDQINSVLQGKGPHESLKNRLKFAYMALGQLSEEDKTVDGCEMALRCYEQLRDMYKSEYDEVGNGVHTHQHKQQDNAGVNMEMAHVSVHVSGLLTVK